jgi:hypothetical protein
MSRKLLLGVPTSLSPVFCLLEQNLRSNSVRYTAYLLSRLSMVIQHATYAGLMRLKDYDPLGIPASHCSLVSCTNAGIHASRTQSVHSQLWVFFTK